jgi:hypothetical protein
MIIKELKPRKRYFSMEDIAEDELKTIIFALDEYRSTFTTSNFHYRMIACSLDTKIKEIFNA